MRYLSSEQSAAVDQLAITELGIPGAILMENAGRGCVDELESAGIRGKVWVLCGPGNNGGDGLVIARHLFLRGYQVKVDLLFPASKFQGDAKLNHEIATNLGIEICDRNIAESFQLHATPDDFNSEDWIIDAVFGTGARLPLSQSCSVFFEWINLLSAKKCAIDLPTGVDGNTGSKDPNYFHPDLTCVLLAAKKCMDPEFSQDSAAFGQVKVVSIGTPEWLLEKVIGA